MPLRRPVDHDLTPSPTSPTSSTLTTRAIRFYEDEGLLSPRRAAPPRSYPKRDRVRLKLILRGKRLGLSLSEIRDLLDLYDSAPTSAAQLAMFIDVLVAARLLAEDIDAAHARRGRARGAGGG